MGYVSVVYAKRNPEVAVARSAKSDEEEKKLEFIIL